ncbi:hypothetical protein KVA01_10340 [Kocuria varians]|uniref:Uncharacterized protein n=1 Tax=Kocuria varians TaxID=1272 RepID=A0A4Y4D4J6_KOCVA|nr:hypothetical protein [Kocuria varians]GEC98879.1 hypothetical protein KVA01_10340 [Kocuria varians]
MTHVTPDPAPRAPSAASSSGRPKLPAAVRLFTLASFLNAVGTQGGNVYASLFAVRAMGYSTTVAELLMGVMGVGILSRIGWGRVAAAYVLCFAAAVVPGRVQRRSAPQPVG